MKKLRWLITLIFLVWRTSAYTVIDFDQYKNNLLTYEHTTFSSQLIDQAFNQIKHRKCGYKKYGDYYIIAPICLRKKKYPKLKLKEAIDTIRPYVQGFENEYDLENEEFIFEGTKPIIDYDQISLMNQFHNTQIQKKTIAYLEKNHIKIKIHKKYFARYSIDNFSFYPVKRIISTLWPCARTNFKVSHAAMNGLYFKSEQTFNLNYAIAYLPWYCKWGTPNTNYRFYGWSCGSAWQLFRTALITPGITITKRYPHIRRRAQFYGKTIFGDDAAIIGDEKILEIRNDGILPIYFRTLWNDNYQYLVAIKPIKTQEIVKITKKQTWNLSAQVVKKTIDKFSNQVNNIQIFDSYYYQYYNGGV